MFHRKSPKMDVRGPVGKVDRGRVFLVHRREPAGEGTKGVFFLVHKRDLSGYGVLSAQGYEKA